MNRPLLWKLCLIIAAGIVSLFYLIDLATFRTEERMSLIEAAHRAELQQWADYAESLYHSKKFHELDQWLTDLQLRESTWAAVAKTEVIQISGSSLPEDLISGYHLGRSVDWKIHLYFHDNPTMELPFSNNQASLLVQLPERMRPGSNWPEMHIVIQVLLPLSLLGLLSLFLYRHIMSPLRKLQLATKEFTSGNLGIRIRQSIGNRSDELADLARTFDQMAERIEELITSQRQLISDLSHELRTPLARLDIALSCLNNDNNKEKNLKRIERESLQIRKLVEDSLTLAWLENERPELKKEDVELSDLLDVLARDALFEFPDRRLNYHLPNSLIIKNTSHLALGQAIENILRNAMRYTPRDKAVSLSVYTNPHYCQIEIADQGPGINPKLLDKIFKPFFRIENDRPDTGKSFGLGLALARRQLAIIGGRVWAENIATGGLTVFIRIPII